MPWKTIDAGWRDYAEAFAHRFPEADRSAVEALQGDIKGLREYLAIAHDLTLKEATEAVDAWTATLRFLSSKAA